MNTGATNGENMSFEYWDTFMRKHHEHWDKVSYEGKMFLIMWGEMGSWPTINKNGDFLLGFISMPATPNAYLFKNL